MLEADTDSESGGPVTLGLRAFREPEAKVDGG